MTTSVFPEGADVNVEPPPAVSVVIPCCNERGHIENCLRSIFEQEPVPGGFEVIVADGMSDDGTRRILSKLAGENPGLRMVDNPDHIVSAGLNAAIQKARGAVIIRMDAHTVYAPDYLRTCSEVLQTTGADNVGGSWVAKGEGTIGKAIAAAFQSPFSFGDRRGHNPLYEGLVDTVYLGCWSRQVFERIGLFDEELVRNQDDELNLRLTRAGGRIWQSPRIRSWYMSRSSLGALFKQYMQYGYWKVRVMRKHKLPASPRHLVPGLFVFMMAALSLMALRWRLAGLALMALAGVYFICAITASLFSAGRHSWKLFPVLPAIFACCHFAYGYGSLRGVWDFMILRRGPHANYKRLSRISADNRLVTRY
jgi:succinoglycan biosynthesis protein ExoA